MSEAPRKPRDPVIVSAYSMQRGPQPVLRTFLQVVRDLGYLKTAHYDVFTLGKVGPRRIGWRGRNENSRKCY